MHGTLDRSVPFISTENFAASMRTLNHPVSVRRYCGLTHTDPIIEVPFGDKVVVA